LSLVEPVVPHSSTIRCAALIAVFLVAGFLLPSGAAAHTIQITGVSVKIENNKTNVLVLAHTPLLAGADPMLAIPQRLHLLLGGKPFVPHNAKIEPDKQLDLVTWTAEQDGAPSSVQMESPIFPDRPEDTTVLLVYRDGKMVDRATLTPANPTALAGETNLAVVQRFIVMGIRHIFTGPDHMMFVLGLILVGGTLRQLFTVVTAFTIAHSITLTLTVLGVSSMAPRFVEPIIALSIAAVGLENILRIGAYNEVRAWMAFSFGFFHGFGFAGALAEVGLPRQALAWSLGSFNIGVEIAQACIVLVTVPTLAYINRKNPSFGAKLVKGASGVILLAGLIWFVERVASYHYF
jgi:hydrogenase/urease accessory protein HupE